MYRPNLVFAAACLGMLLFGVVFLSLGSVNNMLAERFGLDDIEIGTLTALLPAGILAGSLVFGPVVDRFGYRWMLVVAALAVGAGLEGLALAQSKGTVQACVFLLGLSGGVLNGATNALAADVSAGQRGARLSLLGACFGLGALAMPSLLAALSGYYPISRIVACIGAAALVPAAFCLAIEFPPPKQRAAGTSLGEKFGMLRDPWFLIAGLALAIQSGMEGMSNDWLTRYFKNVTLAGGAPSDGLALGGLATMTAAMMIARLALSACLKRVRSGAVLLAGVAVTAVGVFVLMRAPGFGAALVAASLIGAGLAAAFPVVLGYIGDRYPDRSGTAFSMAFTLALIGNMAINKAFGYVAHLHGIEQYAKVMLGLLAASGVLLATVITRRHGTTNGES